MQREMKVVLYDPSWKKQFCKIKAELEAIFDGLRTDIRHFGSTSVEGMPAKPIIDIMILVEDISKVDLYNAKMIEAGYVPKGEHGIAGRRYFQKFASDGINHIEHIHCYERANQHAMDELMFCEYLKNDKKAFVEYQAVKLEAMEKFRFDPAAYAEYKASCINNIMHRAKSCFRTYN